MDSIIDLIAGDDMASKMGVISAAVAGAAVAATALVMRSSRKRKAEEEKKNKESQGKLGSALEELTQKERERRKRLEEELEQARILKEERAKEIERLRVEAETADAAARGRQAELAREAEEKKRLETARLNSERAALREMQTKGARCTFSLPTGQQGVLELMIATVDAVGFMTTIAHVKSRLKADYPGQPLESHQTLTHCGQVLQDSKKLNDIVTAMPSPFTPLHFEVAISPPKQARAQTPPKPCAAARASVEDDKKDKNEQREQEEEIKVTVKSHQGKPNVQVTALQGWSVGHVRKAVAESDGYRSEVAGELSGSLSLIFAGKILKDEELLSVLTADYTCRTAISIHAVIKQAAQSPTPAPPSGDTPPKNEMEGAKSATPGSTTPLGGAATPRGGHSAGAGGAAGSVGTSPFTPSSPYTPSGQQGGPKSPSATPQGDREAGAGAAAWMEALKKQIEETTKRAFWDLLDKALASDPPDYEWVVRLYKELADRLCAITPSRGDLHAEIHAALDPELFEQMLRNDAFDAGDLSQMVSFTFARLSGLCSPARDDEIASRRKHLEELLGKGDAIKFADFVVPYLKAFHQTVDDIEGDMKVFREAVKARSGGVTPHSAGSRSANGGNTPSAVPSSPGSTVGGIKAKLRQLGVSDERIAECVERSELDALLSTALGRASGLVSGGTFHPGLVKEQNTAAAAAASTPPTLHLTAPYQVTCKLISGGSSRQANVATGNSDEKVVGLKKRIGDAFGVAVGAATGIRLIQAAKVVSDEQLVSSLASKDGVITVHAVMYNTGGEAASSSSPGGDTHKQDIARQVLPTSPGIRVTLTAEDNFRKPETHAVSGAATASDLLRLLKLKSAAIRFGGRGISEGESVSQLLRFAPSDLRGRWERGEEAVPLSYAVVDDCQEDQEEEEDQGERGRVESTVVGKNADKGRGTMAVVIQPIYGGGSGAMWAVSSGDSISDVLVRGGIKGVVRVVAMGQEVFPNEGVGEAWKRVGGGEGDAAVLHVVEASPAVRGA